MNKLRWLLCCISLLFFCGKPEDVDCSSLADPDRGIELVYPRGGETFTLGNIVEVNWKADPQKVQAVVLAVSLNGSTGPWRNILTYPMDVPAETGTLCMDTVWTPGSEYDAVGYPSGATVLLRVSSAADARLFEVSGMITVDR